VPVRLTVWGFPAALLLMVSVPVRAPLAVGAKVTETVQLAEASTVPRQLFVCAKSPAALTSETVSGPGPLFVKPKLCASLVVPTFWLSKFRLVVERVIAGGTPTPVKLTICGSVAELFAMVIVPNRVPISVG